MTPREPRRSRSVLTAVTVVLALAPGAPAAAGVITPCSFDDGTATLTIDAEGFDPTLGRSGTDIVLNGASCDGASVLSTDLISVVDADAGAMLTIDLASGPFAPGPTDEGDASSEIEITVASADETPKSLFLLGSSGADHLGVDGATNAYNLNTDEAEQDDDLTLDPSFEIIRIDGREGDDVIDTAHTAAHVVGGDGDDRFRSTDDGEVEIDGEAGDDLVSFAANTDPIDLSGDAVASLAVERGKLPHNLYGVETVRTTHGDDDISVGNGITVEALAGDDRIDSYLAADGFDGGPGADELIFRRTTPMEIRLATGIALTDGASTRFVHVESIIGTTHDDLFVAGRHDFAVDGNFGVDTYSVAGSSHGLEVSLDDGRASNGDRLERIEEVVGSRFADVIVGSGGADVLAGRVGNDLMRGLSGPDRLFGGDGDDRLEGGADRDRCWGGAGLDVLVSC